jgi:hypothetical protein
MTTEINTEKITAAANSVMQALSTLSDDERGRVLQSAAALYGLSVRTSPRSQQGSATEKEGDAGFEANEGNRNQIDDGGKRQSVVEFLKEKAPATNSQRIACFAYYREHVEGKGTKFARRDLEPYFALAKLASPGKNYGRDYTDAVKEGWIHDDGADSYLTQGGENEVSAGFGGKAKPRGPQAAQRKARKKAAPKP